MNKVYCKEVNPVFPGFPSVLDNSDEVSSILMETGTWLMITEGAEGYHSAAEYL